MKIAPSSIIAVTLCSSILTTNADCTKDECQCTPAGGAACPDWFVAYYGTTINPSGCCVFGAADREANICLGNLNVPVRKLGMNDTVGSETSEVPACPVSKPAGFPDSVPPPTPSPTSLKPPCTTTGCTCLPLIDAECPDWFSGYYANTGGWSATRYCCKAGDQNDDYNTDSDECAGRNCPSEKPANFPNKAPESEDSPTSVSPTSASPTSAISSVMSIIALAGLGLVLA